MRLLNSYLLMQFRKEDFFFFFFFFFEDALLTEQIERHASSVLHCNVMVAACFGRNILIRTDDLLILFDISIRYD